MSYAGARSLTMAIIGCGGMARRHLAGLAHLNAVGENRPLDITAVADLDARRAELLADEAEQLLGTRPAVFTDLNTMIDARPAQALDINTALHSDIALAALDAGLHLLVEKPLTATVREADAIVAAAARRSLIVAVAENIRREPANRLAAELLSSGVLGNLRFVLDQTFAGADHIQLTPWRHDRRSGGVLLDVGVHAADVIEYLAGPVTSVSAVSGLDHPVRVRPDRSAVRAAPFYAPFQADLPEFCHADAPDVLAAVLQFENGALGQWTVHQAAHGRPFSRRTILGDRGSLTLPADRSGGQPIVELDDGRQLIGSDILPLVPQWQLSPVEARIWGETRPTASDPDFSRTDAALVAIELEDFARAVATGTSPEVDAARARRAIALVEGALLAAEHHRPVEIAALEFGARIAAAGVGLAEPIAAQG